MFIIPHVKIYWRGYRQEKIGDEAYVRANVMRFIIVIAEAEHQTAEAELIFDFIINLVHEPVAVGCGTPSQLWAIIARVCV